MSFLDSLKTAAKTSHPKGHERINTAIKATMQKASVVTKTIAVETIGNALVIADPLTSKLGSIAGGWWSGVENAADAFDKTQAAKQASAPRAVAKQ
jgi:hypothetical protein